MSLLPAQKKLSRQRLRLAMRRSALAAEKAKDARESLETIADSAIRLAREEGRVELASSLLFLIETRFATAGSDSQRLDILFRVRSVLLDLLGILTDEELEETPGD